MVQRKNFEYFLVRYKEKHGHFYDYSLSNYVNAKTKIKIICPIHGEFEQLAREHIHYGCKKCGMQKVAKILKLSKNEFIDKCNLIHNSKYEYSLTNYINNKQKIKIICPKHGLFLQSPKHHIRGHGCPSCGNNYSRGEEKIKKWLNSNNIKYIQQHRFEDCKGPKYKLPFDFYIPDFNMCIEFDGKHHSVPIFGEKSFLKNKKSELIKNNYCLENKIKLLRIGYLDEKNIKEILDAIMSNGEYKKNIYSHLFVSK
jgi:hypothetical protein